MKRSSFPAGKKSRFSLKPTRSRRAAWRAKSAARIGRLEVLEDRRLLAAVAATLDTFGLAEIGGLHVNGDDYAADRVLVRSNAGAGAFQQALGAASLGARALGQSQWWSVRLAADVAATHAVAALRQSGFEAQLDYVVSIASYTDTDFNDANDNLYVNRMQWGLENTGQDYGGGLSGTAGADINAPGAWLTTKGSDQIVVAVIDTGLDYNHADLADNVWRNPDEFGGVPGFDDDGNGYADDIYGWDFYNNDADPMDDNGHGTHVAGILGGAGNNSIGIAGVAWDVSIMALKFLSGSGSGYTSGAIGALDYVTQMRQRHDDPTDGYAGANVRVANNSWGGGGYDQALKDAIDRSGVAEILFTAAAGNGHWLFGYGLDNDANPHYPSSYTSTNIVAVAATNANDQLTSFSNWGATSVDLAAPGEHIWSTWPKALDTSDGTNDGLYRATGTSMATPFVSGAAALLWSVNPELTVADVKAILMEKTDYIGNETYGKPTVTNGRLNAQRAVEEAARRATPSLSISDVTVMEGDLGTAEAVFTVTRSGKSDVEVWVDYATADGVIDAATAGSDYTAASGTLTFLAGETSKTIAVAVNGDTVVEPNEIFFVNLTASPSSPASATIADAQGQGTIVDDDSLPSVTIDDKSVVEGNSGTTNAVFTVRLSSPSSKTVTVDYSTADGTSNPATAGSDYTAANGTLTFSPGETSKLITVPVQGDVVVEANETFFVNLHNAVNATLADSQGVGTITNDDASSYTFASTDVPAPLRGRTATISYLTISQDIAIADLNVKVDISHGNDKDLDIYLYAPDGRRVALFWGRGGSGDNIRATFDDEALLHISQGKAPFDGSYRPEEPLSRFDGQSAQGTWQLRVENWGKRKGTVNAWSITVSTSASSLDGAATAANASSRSVAAASPALFSKLSSRRASGHSVVSPVGPSSSPIRQAAVSAVTHRPQLEPRAVDRIFELRGKSFDGFDLGDLLSLDDDLLDA